MMNKKNTFTDFIAAAETLIKEGYTSADRLAIGGAASGRYDKLHDVAYDYAFLLSYIGAAQ
jgi:protease II